MVKHVVMWKLREEANGVSGKENAAELKRKLETLPAYIDAIEHLEVGIGFREAEGRCLIWY